MADKLKQMHRKKILLMGGILLVALVAGLCVQKPEGTKPTPTPLQPSEELKLSDFPEAFKDSTLIIVGDNASDIEMQAANEIAEYLENETGNKPLIKKYSEISDEDKRNYNLIVVGTPKTNLFLEEVYAMTNATRVTEEFPGEGKGVLEILRNPWDESKAMLLVEGSDGWGVKAGSERTKDNIISKGEAQVTHPILSQAFPNVTFYKVITEPTLPPRYGIVAVYKGKEYHMPKEFNHLMFDYNISLTDLNAVDYAKAFIILSNPALSRISFSNVTWVNESGCDFKIRVKAIYFFKEWNKTKSTEEEWKFLLKRNQFLIVRKEIIAPEEEVGWAKEYYPAFVGGETK